MNEHATEPFRAVGPGDAIPDDYVVPYYLSDRKLRISIARVGGRLYAFEDLCTCSSEACPLSAGLLAGRRSCASATARATTSAPEP